MKQLVSVVQDGHVRYYTADGGEVDEFARIKVPAQFGVESAVGLGLNLSAALGMDAPVRRGRPAAIEAVATRALDKPRTRQDRSAFTADMVWEALSKFEQGARAGEVAEAMGMTNRGDRHTVGNRILTLFKQGRVVRTAVKRLDGMHRGAPTYQYEVVRPALSAVAT